jgi:hypothetical protein
MPISDVLGGSIIGGATELAGAALGGKAAKSAAKTQAQTTDKTLLFAREQEAAKKLQYEAAMKAYQAKWEAWQGQRQALLQRYGVDIAPPTRPGAAGPPTAAPGGPTGVPGPSGGYTGRGGPPVASGVAPAPSPTLGGMAMSPGEQMQGSPAMGAAAMPKWDDWAGMGLRQA